MSETKEKIFDFKKIILEGNYKAFEELKQYITKRMDNCLIKILEKHRSTYVDEKTFMIPEEQNYCELILFASVTFISSNFKLISDLC